MAIRTIATTILAATLAATTAAGPALAQQTPSPSTAPAAALTVPEVIERLTAQGYSDITEVERDDGRYEVEARQADGTRMELDVDMRTGEILKSERDD